MKDAGTSLLGQPLSICPSQLAWLMPTLATQPSSAAWHAAGQAEQFQHGPGLSPALTQKGGWMWPLAAWLGVPYQDHGWAGQFRF